MTSTHTMGGDNTANSRQVESNSPVENGGRAKPISANRTTSPPGASSSPPGAHSTAAPVGHTFRRAVTNLEDAALAGNVRRRYGHAGTGASGGFGGGGDDFDGPRRRSSNFSDYSLNEARKTLSSLSTDGLLNPSVDHNGKKEDADSAISWASLPLVFALFPAVAGMFFKNGSAMVTDVMLLALAAIFLYWSVTQPW
jgi:hypothetical protein